MSGTNASNVAAQESPVSRRAFVAGSAGLVAALSAGGVAGAAAVQPSRAGGPGPNGRLNIGIIGTGMRGRNLMRGRLLPSDRYRIVAVCDVDRDRREHYAKLCGDHYADAGSVRAYKDDDELLARDDIDAVFILTPDHWHATQSLKALRAGKHVYCEKPLTHTLHEGKVLAREAEKARRYRGLHFITGSQQRTEYDHKFVRLVDLVRNGTIGEVMNANIGVNDPARWCDLPTQERPEGLDWDRWLGPAPWRGYNEIMSPRGVHSHYPRHRWFIEYANGELADWWAHHGDIATWACGLDRTGPVEVLPPGDDDSLRGATLVYENGVRITHGAPHGLFIIGTEGMVFGRREYISSTPSELVDTQLSEGADLQPRHGNLEQHFLDCIEGTAEPICDATIGAHAARDAQLLNIAYRLRRPLRWNPRTWSFVGDDEANGLLDYERREPFGLPG